MPAKPAETLADMQTRYAVQGPLPLHTTLHFQSWYDRQIVGNMSIIHHTTRNQLVWDEFYPFGGPSADTERRDLIGSGLGALAHAETLLRLMAALDISNDYEIRHMSAVSERRDQLERMGNLAAADEYVSFPYYVVRSLHYAEDLGFRFDQERELLRDRYRYVMK